MPVLLGERIRLKVFAPMLPYASPAAPNCIEGDIMPRFWGDNSLSLAMFGLFALFLAAQSVTGWQVYAVSPPVLTPIRRTSQP